MLDRVAIGVEQGGIPISQRLVMLATTPAQVFRRAAAAEFQHLALELIADLVLTLSMNLTAPAVASACSMICPSWMRGSMSISFRALIVSMIWPVLSPPLTDAGEPASMEPPDMVKAG